MGQDPGQPALPAPGPSRAVPQPVAHGDGQRARLCGSAKPPSSGLLPAPLPRRLLRRGRRRPAPRGGHPAPAIVQPVAPSIRSHNARPRRARTLTATGPAGGAGGTSRPYGLSRRSRPRHGRVGSGRARPVRAFSPARHR